MSILYDFDEKKYMRMMREEYREEGREEGRKEGREVGREEKCAEIAYHMFDRSRTPKEVSDLIGEPIEYITWLHKEYTQMVQENGTHHMEKKVEGK